MCDNGSAVRTIDDAEPGRHPMGLQYMQIASDVSKVISACVFEFTCYPLLLYIKYSTSMRHSAFTR